MKDSSYWFRFVTQDYTTENGKRLEDFAVSKFFDLSNEQLVAHDVFDYVRNSRMQHLCCYDKLRAALRAVERLGEDYLYYLEDYDNAREATNLCCN